MGSVSQPGTLGVRMVSMFAGVGGFDLGFERAGIATVWQCEIDEFCTTILAQHWPHIPRAGDIREVSPHDVPCADVWTCGFPCQDVSFARLGRRSGLRGRRSGLFHPFAELVAACRPPTVVIENVTGLLSSHAGGDFGTVIATLADIGYGVAWRVLDSRHFGVPQSRRRVFICGTLGDPGRAGATLFEPECRDRDSAALRRNGPQPVPAAARSIRDPRRGVVKDIAYCVSAESGRHTGTDWSRNYVSYSDGRVRRVTPLESERLQGFPDDWTLPAASRVPHEKLDTARYRACGNALSVPVATWVARRLIAASD